MAKIEAGCKLADFSFNTPFESDVKLSEKAKGAKKTILLFLRYYGCTLCQLDMRDLAAAYPQFQEKNTQLLVVLQSDPALVAEQIDVNTFPFTIVCDPRQEIYNLYGIKGTYTTSMYINITEGTWF